jgi:N-acyl-L-homoserine lactone synthetase
MIFVVGAGSRGHYAADLAAMHAQRKAVFVDRAGWKVPVIADLEIDRYDLLQETVYLLAKDEAEGQVRASVRLLTTSGPHLMWDLYPPASRAAFPSGPAVWEISRYCTAPGLAGRARRLGFLWQTICGVLELGLARGIDQVIFAANRALLPLVLRCGWDARAIGPTLDDADDEVTAVAAAITRDGLRRVRQRYGVPDPVIRTLGAEDTPILPRQDFPHYASIS